MAAGEMATRGERRAHRRPLHLPLLWPAGAMGHLPAAQCSDQAGWVSLGCLSDPASSLAVASSYPWEAHKREGGQQAFLPESSRLSFVPELDRKPQKPLGQAVEVPRVGLLLLQASTSSENSRCPCLEVLRAH